MCVRVHTCVQTWDRMVSWGTMHITAQGPRGFPIHHCLLRCGQLGPQQPLGGIPGLNNPQILRRCSPMTSGPTATQTCMSPIHHNSTS